MSKYIDADKLKRHYAWWDDETKIIFDEIIDLQPAADVEEVVRCKECKHTDLFYPYCTIWEAAIDGDGFCYKGEKE